MVLPLGDLGTMSGELNRRFCRFGRSGRAAGVLSVFERSQWGSKPVEAVRSHRGGSLLSAWEVLQALGREASRLLARSESGRL